MLVLADSKIPMAGEAFAEFGEVRTLATPEISARSVRDAEILLVRSETPVNRDLLDGSKVRFVGTATIGTDHVDLEWLASAGIGFSAAPGCNADSVKEYVIAALLRLAVARDLNLRGKTLGVVGVGNIGGRVARAAPALGLKVLLNDPPRARESGDSRFLPLDGLMDADFVTLHVPLHSGRDDTFHLFDGHRLGRLKPGAVLINTSRGPIVDNLALKELLRAGRLGATVLDVWEGEPEIDGDLLEMVDIGTSHIAGYSLDGKVRGTRLIYEAACRRFDRKPAWQGLRGLPRPPCEEIRLEEVGATRDRNEAARLHEIVSRCYDIAADDARLRPILSIQPKERPGFFRDLRKNYPIRREFSATLVTGDGTRGGPLLEKLRLMGFSTR